jgi:hypothetical protein
MLWAVSALFMLLVLAPATRRKTGIASLRQLASAPGPIPVRLHQDLSPGPGRRAVSSIRYDGRLPPLVRDGAAELAGLWARLNTVTPASARRNTGAVAYASAARGDSRRAPVAAAAPEIAVARNAVRAAEMPPLSPLEVRHRAVVAPLSPDRYKLQVTISAATQEKLRHAQNLLRHTMQRGRRARQ